ncbi:MAG: DUF1646 family protein, partial [Elusimicrobia bacterium]|nr:DUF1646 family protein [Elusimicrobiota bacterium]
AVLIVGFVFREPRRRIRKVVPTLESRLGLPLAMAAIVLLLGLASSLITAIVAALILAEVVDALRLERRYELRLVVCACYAIGLGAALTPLGEPLSTIVVSKLKGPPHDAGFFYLLRLLGLWVAPGMLVAAATAAWKVGKPARRDQSLHEDYHESWGTIALRAAKVYLFVMALVLLGAGLQPLAERLLGGVPDWMLYWLNCVSAILDNATLAAAEIVPAMNDRTMHFVLMSLLVSGGLLIPGNIPNIISAAKLGIRSREWARAAAPLGLALLLGYFAALVLLL